MENTKRCPVGLAGYEHYCPEDPKKHAPLSKIKHFLESKFFGVTSFDIAEQPQNAGHWETLQFIRNGCRDTAAGSLQEQKKKEYLAKLKTEGLRQPTPAVEAEKPAEITEEQKEAMARIKELRAQQGLDMASPGAEPDEENLLDCWQNDPNVRAEFISYESFRAYTLAASQGRAKIVGGRTTR